MKTFLMLLMFFASGCATIIQGTEQILTVKTDVPGVSVYWGEEYLGVTPLTAPVPKRINRTLRLKKEAYETLIVDLPTQMEGTFWINIGLMVISVGSFGATTDVINHAAWKYAPNSFYIEMRPLKTSTDNRDDPKDKLKKRFLVFNGAQLQKEEARQGGEFSETLKAIGDL